MDAAYHVKASNANSKAFLGSLPGFRSGLLSKKYLSESAKQIGQITISSSSSNF